MISVLIPVLNEERYIYKLLKYLLNQEFDYHKLDIIIIDGKSGDKTLEIINSYVAENMLKNVTILQEEKKCVAGAINMGVKIAKGKYILKMDVHAEYSKDYIKKCIEYLEKYDVDCVGGPMRAIGSNYISNSISLIYGNIFGLGGGKFHKNNYEGYADTVFLGAYKKDIFDKIGLWDEEIKDADDDDFNYRIIGFGGKIYLSKNIISYYYVRTKITDFIKQIYGYGFSKALFVKKHKDIRFIHHVMPTIFIATNAIIIIMALINYKFIKLFYAITFVYLATIALNSILIVIKSRIKYIIMLPVVFICAHYSYGIGFLIGCLKKYRKR